VKHSLLLIEDDADLCSLMTAFFEQHGFHVESARDGRSGLARALEGAFDLIVLDVMLPVIDGFEVLRQMRKRVATPVIMLTARTEREDRVAGLDAGADDYLPKPFGPDELLARIRAVLRRAGKPAVSAPSAIEAGSLRLNPQTREIRYRGRSLELTSIEFDILEFLVRSQGRVVSRDELAAILYQRRATPYERSLDVHISHLRKKLAQPSAIRTIRGAGYLFSPDTFSPDAFSPDPRANP
jgi:two-component system response regulator CpxR